MKYTSFYITQYDEISFIIIIFILIIFLYLNVDNKFEIIMLDTFPSLTFYPLSGKLTAKIIIP